MTCHSSIYTSASNGDNIVKPSMRSIMIMILYINPSDKQDIISMALQVCNTKPGINNSSDLANSHINRTNL